MMMLTVQDGMQSVAEQCRCRVQKQQRNSD